MLSFNVSAEGLDRLYSKPDENKTWPARFAERVGYVSGFSKSYALVVGISQYDDHNDLPTAKDPIKVRDFLIASGFDEVHVLTEEKVTLERLNILMLDEFPGKIDKNDRFLLYWSGHGVERDNTFGGQTGFLPLANSSKGSFANVASMDDISRWDGFLKARHVLYIIDACFSGLAGNVTKSSQSELAIEQMLKPARYLLTAGAAEEEVIASDKWGGSLFTSALLSGLSGAADATTKGFPSDGVVSLYELIAHIKKRVANDRDLTRWPKPITPQLRDLRTSDGEFFFLTSGYKSTVPIPETAEAIEPIPETAEATVATKSGLDFLPPDKKYEEAFYAYNQCVSGKAYHCGILGNMYNRGDDVAQDAEKAVSLLKRACDGGYAGGCGILALMYDYGDGVAQDSMKAVPLYQNGCDGGDAKSCGSLGFMYSKGEGVAQDKDKAVSLYKQGCDGGDSWSCDKLGK